MADRFDILDLAEDSPWPLQGPLKKGRIVLPSTRAQKQFMFNPSELERSHSWDWARQKIPGNSHPVYNGGSGSDESISFTLILDGDRGRMLERRGVGSNTRSNANTFSVARDIQFFYSLTFPERESAMLRSIGAVTGATPPLFVLTLGGMRTLGIMESVKVTMRQWTRNLDIMRASLEVKMFVFEPVPVFNDDIYDSSDDEAKNDLVGTRFIGGGK